MHAPTCINSTSHANVQGHVPIPTSSMFRIDVQHFTLKCMLLQAIQLNISA
jgi:hypothetical protein